jgi:hypothetical protein
VVIPISGMNILESNLLCNIIFVSYSHTQKALSLRTKKRVPAALLSGAVIGKFTKERSLPCPAGCIVLPYRRCPREHLGNKTPKSRKIKKNGVEESKPSTPF